MAMFNPPHPSEFIATVYLEPNGIGGRKLAAKLGVAPSTLNRILTGVSSISPEMALRLSKCLGRSPVELVGQAAQLWAAVSIKSGASGRMKLVKVATT